jgi:hypothetical protein
MNFRHMIEALEDSEFNYGDWGIGLDMVEDQGGNVVYYIKRFVNGFISDALVLFRSLATERNVQPMQNTTVIDLGGYSTLNNFIASWIRIIEFNTTQERHILECLGYAYRILGAIQMLEVNGDPRLVEFRKNYLPVVRRMGDIAVNETKKALITLSSIKFDRNRFRDCLRDEYEYRSYFDRIDPNGVEIDYGHSTGNITSLFATTFRAVRRCLPRRAEQAGTKYIKQFYMTLKIIK